MNTNPLPWKWFLGIIAVCVVLAMLTGCAPECLAFRPVGGTCSAFR